MKKELAIPGSLAAPVARRFSHEAKMLTQVNHWMEYASAGIDAILLLRVLALRLQRVYVFLTLACVLVVLFDVVLLSLSPESPERLRVEVYSNLLFAFVFPLAAWDVFEEVGNPLAAIRRVAILRTIASLIMMALFGLIMASSAYRSDDPTGLVFVFDLTLIVSTGSTAGCLAFFWVMNRGIRDQKLVRPNNTFVWMTFYTLFLAGQLASWFLFLIEEALKLPSAAPFPQIAYLALTIFGIAITVWCAAKLRALPKDLPSASLNENS